MLGLGSFRTMVVWEEDIFLKGSKSFVFCQSIQLSCPVNLTFWLNVLATIYSDQHFVK